MPNDSSTNIIGPTKYTTNKFDSTRSPLFFIFFLFLITKNNEKLNRKYMDDIHGTCYIYKLLMSSVYIKEYVIKGPANKDWFSWLYIIYIWINVTFKSPNNIFHIYRYDNLRTPLYCLHLQFSSEIKITTATIIIIKSVRTILFIIW